MLPVAIISLFGVLGMLFLIFRRPAVHIGRAAVSVFYLPPLVSALLLLFLGYLTPQEAVSGLAAAGAVNPLKILVLFFSMTLLSVLLDEAGFFAFLAGAVLRRAGKSQLRLFCYLFIAVSLLTVFTSNDIVVLTFTPFICYFCHHAEIDPVPYLFGEFVAANTWSMVLMIGNPTNIYLSAARVDFFGYLRLMWLPTLLAGVVSFAFLLLLFGRKLRAPIAGSPPEKTEMDRPSVALGLTALFSCVALLSLSSFLGLPMWRIALFCFLGLYLAVAAELLWRRRGLALLRRSLLRTPLDTAPFVLSMFLLVLALHRAGVTGALSGLLLSGNEIFTFGIASFLSANLINNIPMSVLFSFLCAAPGAGEGALFAAVIGSNLGAFLTPVGALAGIMWMAMLRGNGVPLSFGRFTRYGAAVSVPALLAALWGLSVLL